MSLVEGNSHAKPFSVAEDCIRLGLRAGAVIFRDVHIADEQAELRSEIAITLQALATRYPDKEAIRSSPEVTAFREILRKVGINPRREQPSLQRLLEFGLKRGELPKINSLVDAYNLVSVRRGCSLGAHDLDCITLPVSLRMLTGEESFTPLDRSQSERGFVGEFGYVDAQSRMLCRLDILQADFSKVSTTTRHVLLIVEATASHRREDLEKAFHDVRETVCRYCGGTAEIVATPF